jgi:hypothetical protein
LPIRRPAEDDDEVVAYINDGGRDGFRWGVATSADQIEGLDDRASVIVIH